MSTPHIHAELIHHWADGGKIEAAVFASGPWYDQPYPSWNPALFYRKKPIPKPNIVVLRYATLGEGNNDLVVWGGISGKNPNIKLIFDSETPHLQDVVMI